MRDISEIFQYSHKMMIDGNNRSIAFDAYRQMYHSGWDLPDAVRNIEWIQKVVNADCYDAIQTGMRILATIPLSLTYQPLAPGQVNKDRAGEIETVLKWNLMSSNKRRSRSIESEMAKNALLYDLCAVQVVELHYQIKEKDKLDLDSAREKQALAHGRFMMVPYDSRSVFAEWSNLMLERVLIVQHKHAQEVVDEWGKAAMQYPELVDLMSKPYGQDWITFYDYYDMDTRVTWAAQGRRWEVPFAEGHQRWILNQGDAPTPFLPFAIRGGSTLETNAVHAYQPLLYPVYATGAWDIKNIIRSLEVSEVIAHTGSPRLAEEGPNQQVGQVDYMSPDRVVKMPPGNTLKQIQPAAIDAALGNVDALLSAQIHKSTISEVLQGGDLPAGTAFATLNLMTQTAVGVLKPFQHLVETTLADMFGVMLKWVEFTGKDLYGYGTGMENSGAEYEIISNEIEPDAIYLSVELHPDTPTDKAQKITAAVSAVQGLEMSWETGLEEIGIEDPSAEMKRRASEKIFEHEMQMEFSREMLEMEAEIQIKSQAAMMQLQMAMQESQGGAQGETPPEQPAPEQITAGPPGAQGPPPGEISPEGVPQGPGANPAEGAMPPGMMAPGQNAEGAGLPMAPEGGGELL
jgi:hypothetical protein